MPAPTTAQRALVFHPDDPLFARFRWRMEREQGDAGASRRGRPRQPALDLPDWLEEEMAETRERHGIVPLESNALALRLCTLRPGPGPGGRARRGARGRTPQGELLEPPSVAERRLRQRLGELVAAQAVEDAGGGRVRRGGAAARGRAVPRLQRGAEARARRQGARRDDAGGAGGGAGLARPQPAARPPAPAGGRPPLRLGGAQAGGNGRPPVGRAAGPSPKRGASDPGR